MIQKNEIVFDYDALRTYKPYPLKENLNSAPEDSTASPEFPRQLRLLHSPI